MKKIFFAAMIFCVAGLTGLHAGWFANTFHKMQGAYSHMKEEALQKSKTIAHHASNAAHEAAHLAKEAAHKAKIAAGHAKDKVEVAFKTGSRFAREGARLAIDVAHKTAAVAHQAAKHAKVMANNAYSMAKSTAGKVKGMAREAAIKGFGIKVAGSQAGTGIDSEQLDDNGNIAEDDESGEFA